MKGLKARVCWHGGHGQWQDAGTLFEIWSREENLTWGAGRWIEIKSCEETGDFAILIKRKDDKFEANIALFNAKEVADTIQEVYDLILISYKEKVQSAVSCAVQALRSEYLKKYGKYR